MKRILFAASECVPFASSGGLGDVIGSLPEQIQKQSKNEYEVRVILPLYKQVSAEYRSQMTKICEFYVPLAWRNQYCGVYSADFRGVTYYFLDNEYYFARNNLYGEYDDGERYAFFCKAVIEALPHIGYIPDVLHAHDWQTALTVVYVKTKYGHIEEYRKMKTVFTIHNIAYQGIYNKGIAYDVFEIPEGEESVLEYKGDLNLMKGAIQCADMVSTVSPTYAKEILSPVFSHGLHYILEENKDKLCGILNGIDRDYYNPSKDKSITANYSYMKTEGKKLNKEYLQKKFNLPVKSDVPLLSVVSRLADHKGIDIIMYCIDEILQNDVQLVVLGKGENSYESFFNRLAERYPDKVGVYIGFDKELAKSVYAGSDIFLMPSRSEPCGLSQMIASRYGAFPVVRETGGLYDSIRDIGWIGGGNGFTFAPYNATELRNAVLRAVNYYRDEEKRNNLIKVIMKWDFSWKKSAKEYIRMLYQ